jgi:WD40 repeat protein
MSEATSSLSWLPHDPALLAVGTGLKWLRVYDLRDKGQAQLSVLAHGKAVKGVQASQFNDFLLATYSDAPGETIRIWDIRKLAKNQTSLHTINPFAWLPASPASVSISQIAWSPHRSGVIAAALSRHAQVLVFSLDGHGQADVTMPVDVKQCSGPIESISWQRCQTTWVGDSEEFQDTFVHRLLIATTRGTVEDLSMHESQPLALTASGTVVFGCGLKIFSAERNAESDATADVENVELMMRRRTAQGYSGNP